MTVLLRCTVPFHPLDGAAIQSKHHSSYRLMDISACARNSWEHAWCVCALAREFCTYLGWWRCAVCLCRGQTIFIHRRTREAARLSVATRSAVPTGSKLRESHHISECERSWGQSGNLQGCFQPCLALSPLRDLLSFFSWVALFFLLRCNLFQKLRLGVTAKSGKQATITVRSQIVTI